MKRQRHYQPRIESASDGSINIRKIPIRKDDELLTQDEYARIVNFCIDDCNCVQLDRVLDMLNAEKAIHRDRGTLLVFKAAARVARGPNSWLSDDMLKKVMCKAKAADDDQPELF